MKSFRIHVADEVLDDLLTRLRRTRFPDQITGIGWTQGTELGWLQRLSNDLKISPNSRSSCRKLP